MILSCRLGRTISSLFRSHDISNAVVSFFPTVRCQRNVELHATIISFFSYHPVSRHLNQSEINGLGKFFPMTREFEKLYRPYRERERSVDINKHNLIFATRSVSPSSFSAFRAVRSRPTLDRAILDAFTLMPNGIVRFIISRAADDTAGGGKVTTPLSR